MSLHLVKVIIPLKTTAKNTKIGYDIRFVVFLHVSFVIFKIVTMRYRLMFFFCGNVNDSISED